MRRNALAVRRTVAALTALGCIEPVDAALVALVRATADQLDRAQPGTSAAASCARVHLLALERLAALGRHDSGDVLDGLLGSLGNPASS